MMSRYIRILSLALVTGILFFSSCKRKGCTNAYCEEFDVKAKKDDGSCNCTDGAISVYSVKDYGQIEIIIGSDNIGKVTDYFPTDLPICGQAGTLIIDYPPGTYTLTASTVLGNNWQKQVVIVEGQCDLLLLE